MADAVTLKDFLVRLGYTVDANSERTFSLSVHDTTLRVIELGRAMIDTAREVGAGFARMAESSDALYFASQRTKSSVQDFNAVAFAISQLGGTAEGAKSSMEGIAAFLRTKPGAAGLLQSLGIDPTAGAAEMLTQFGKKAQELKDSGQYALAKSYADMLGIDEKTLLALTQGIGKFTDFYKKTLKDAGLDADAAAKNGNQIMTEFRNLGAVMDILELKLQETFGRSFADLIKDFRIAITDNFDTIQQWLIWLAGMLAWFGHELKTFWEYLKEWGVTGKGVVEALSGVIMLLILRLITLRAISATMTALSVFGWAYGLAATLAPIAALLADIAGAIDLIRRPFGSVASQDFENEGLGRPDGTGPEGQSPSSMEDWKKDQESPARKFFNQTLPSWVTGAGGKIDDRAAGVMNYLMKELGLSHSQAAGIASNLSAESNFDPTAIEQGVDPAKAGIGIAQWSGSRRAELEAFAAAQGKSPFDLGVQLAFLKMELLGKYRNVLGAVLHQGNAPDAGTTFFHGFEKPAGGDAKLPGHLANSQHFANVPVPDFPDGPNRYGQHNTEQYGPPAPATITQNNHYTINGSKDPHATAAAIHAKQDSLNQSLARTVAATVT